MPTETPRILVEIRYHEAAQEYLRKLPPEHFMEATPQATQRKISWDSLDLIHSQRPDVQVFNELLVQYPLPRRRRLGQVVPDNMVVIHPTPIKALGSYDVPLQPARPFMVLEYDSRSTKRKDYDDNMQRYEHELMVPYYLLFTPDDQELTLYKHTGQRYVTVTPNEQERYPIPELELEVALLDGWVRYWFRGELLPLPGDLLLDRNAARQRAAEERQARLAAEAELAKLRAEIEQSRRPKTDSQ